MHILKGFSGVGRYMDKAATNRPIDEKANGKQTLVFSLTNN